MIKVIEGYNGKYTIDENGNVYSNNKIMHPYKINSGYLCIKLRNKGDIKMFLIHRLVAKYFLEGDGVVDHIDDNKLNNNYKNLRYCTQKENLHFHGYDYNSGINHYKAVVDINTVKTIREYREKLNIRNCEIYKIYPQYSHSTIDQILNYKTYKNI